MTHWISVDIESDGPVPHLYSMVALGAVLVERPDVGYLGHLQPISEQYDPEALAVSGFTREETLEFPLPGTTMWNFYAWIKENAKPPYIFVSDNNGFDWQFANYYFHRFCERNPFGWSSKNINSLFHGLAKDTRARWKHLRKTPHDHNPLHDARGNAEVLLHMRDELGLKVKF